MQIILADEQKVFSEGLTALINHHTDHEVVAAVDNGIDLFDVTLKLRPEIVITDIPLRKMCGLQASQKILKNVDTIKIIFLTTFNDRNTIANAFKVGANGYVLKTCPFEEIQKAIKLVAANQSYLTTEIMNIVVEDFLTQIKSDHVSPCPELSSREREILQLFAEGYSARQIATQLQISHKTVATHREKIYKKLDLYNLVDLARFAIREGITHV